MTRILYEILICIQRENREVGARPAVSSSSGGSKYSSGKLLDAFLSALARISDVV